MNTRLTPKPTFREYLGDSSLYLKMLFIALPISLQSLITVGVNLMDTIMLSSMGDSQISGSSQAGQFITLFQICCMGIGMGANVLTSRFWGMKDLPSLRKTITIMLRFALGFSAAFTLATALFPRQIMMIYTDIPAVIDNGVLYLNWMIPTFICTGLSLTCTIVLRSVGQTLVPLLCSIGAFFVNVFFNWVFIFGKLGAPRMEIEGAALGTLIARVFEILFICGYFFFLDKKIGYRLTMLGQRCKDLVGEYFRISIPVLISDGLLALGNSAVAMIMGRISDAFVAANSMTAVVQQLASVLTIGISNASGIITGHTMGEGNYRKAQIQGYTFMGIAAIIGAVAAGIVMLVKAPIISFYDVSNDAKLIADDLMNAIAVIMVFLAVNSILTKGVLRAGGDTKFLMLGDILFLWVASIPLGALAAYLNWDPFWIYVMLKIDQIIKCVWCFWRLRSGKWLKKIKGQT